MTQLAYLSTYLCIWVHICICIQTLWDHKPFTNSDIVNGNYTMLLNVTRGKISEKF